MSSPCPNCGASKTEPVRHGFIYKLAWVFGYRLRQCSRCRKRRFIRRQDDKSPDSLKLGEEAATAAHFTEEREAAKTAEENLGPVGTKPVPAADSSDRGLRCCPECGSTKYHRTKRTTLEHLLLRPRMARCEMCRARFPYPRHRHESSGPAKLGEAVAPVPRFAEEKRAPKMTEQSFQPKVTQAVTGVNSSNRGLPCCPTCGSTKYHRTKRTTLEHLLLRPKMARCEKCRARFPYPTESYESSGLAKLGEAVAPVPRSAEEKRAPEMVEEGSQTKVAKQVTATDSSKRELRGCPVCGSASYRRTGRTILERILLRPKMARCRNCRTRFPYPKG
jgi:hypothetical protein